VTNGFSNGIWRKTLKTAISSACAVIIANLADTPYPAFSWPWFRHILIGIIVLFIMNEAKYWKNWADAPCAPKGNNDK